MGPLLMLFAIYTAVFLIGMFMMKAGFYTLSGHRLKRWLMRFTATPGQAFLTGFATTALVQSSSAVMVMTVGLVATGYLSFRQSIGIILGSNIGSTITTELMTLDIGDGAIPVLVGGALLVFIGRRRLVYSIGMIAVGLAALLFAMDGFSSLAKPLAAYPLVDAWLHQTNRSTAVGLLVGIALTALVHSSAATIGIAMGFLNEQLLTLPAAIAILLGANIGTCITGLLASIGSSKEAQLTAYTHLWLNVAGVALFLFWTEALARLAAMLSPAPDVQLAHVSVLFNVICSLAALPFVSAIETAMLFLHARRRT
ncbi:Na/Pi cotransporter [Geobacillus sp. 46C-IIa]|uniref:Na/Pi symporter n=1 Tax=Geobacillus sp. 46C-IIa TaxID=1963025 RepID=UPI0009BDC37E|nr:Na/Pi symporter [Geobacillus sp. 46C-IIa]OQP05846.1 Na/Pi cotransporter [Geobacillus sp. 46C-IIa]QNU28799.1 Na/Pi cotransporter family protein [Geobacillus sp. 46C-IIa]